MADRWAYEIFTLEQITAKCMNVRKKYYCYAFIYGKKYDNKKKL